MLIETVTRALADPTRLRMLRLLAHMELAVGELAQVLGQSQPRVSRHVGILCDSGLAQRRREGSWIFLRQAGSVSASRGLRAAVARMLEIAEGEDDAFGARCAEDRRHLAAIRTAREKGAAEYFARHAGEWDQLRSLLSPAKTVEAALLERLEEHTLGRVLDIGTGTGRIAELLVPRAEQVVALDKSTEMLRLARARLQGFAPQDFELVQGDFAALPFAEGTFDTVVLHQVLHYAQEPAQALAEAGRVCRPGGLLAVVDLATHEREELRQRHAHARLGFSDEQMLGWLTASGFVPALPLALPGNGLTTKIWLARSGEPQNAVAGTESANRPAGSVPHRSAMYPEDERP